MRGAARSRTVAAMTKPIDHTDPLHRLAYLAALWSADVKLSYIGARGHCVAVERGGHVLASASALRVRDAWASAVALMERLTAEEDAREAEGEVAS